MVDKLYFQIVSFIRIEIQCIYVKITNISTYSKRASVPIFLNGDVLVGWLVVS